MKKTNVVALVLGAVKGLGRGIGEALARDGVKTALTYWDWEDHLDEMKAIFSSIGTDHMIIRTNLLETGSIEGMIERVIGRFGRLDILVNNIERGGWPVVHGSYVQDQWDLEMAATLRAKRWVFDAAFPYLKASGDGAVVNISSIAGITGRSGPAGLVFNDGYAAANRGVSALTETWARMGAPEVRVNELMLGFVETRHAHKTRGWGLLSDDQKKAVTEHTLLNRIGLISDVVKAVRFLIHDASFMTGSVMRLDGGYVLGGDGVPPMPAGVV